MENLFVTGVLICFMSCSHPLLSQLKHRHSQEWIGPKHRTVSAMFARKLKALRCPSVDNFDLTDQSQLQSVVIFLEDQRIRHYKIEDRAELRNTEDFDKWTKTFHQYLADLQCPHDKSNNALTIDWLLGQAVRLSYGENPEKYRACKPNVPTSPDASGTSISNPLDSLDLDDPAMMAGITSVASMLKIPPHQDHQQVLKALCILVKERLSKEALSAAASHEKKPEDASKDKSTLDIIELGFSTGDYVTDEAMKIVRLLHIRNLRDLQTQINEALVSVQKVTADPKTDQRLGKIGR